MTTAPEEDICPLGTEAILTMQELEAIAQGETWACPTVNLMSVIMSYKLNISNEVHLILQKVVKLVRFSRVKMMQQHLHMKVSKWHQFTFIIQHATNFQVNILI